MWHVSQTTPLLFGTQQHKSRDGGDAATLAVPPVLICPRREVDHERLLDWVRSEQARTGLQRRDCRNQGSISDILALPRLYMAGSHRQFSYGDSRSAHALSRFRGRVAGDPIVRRRLGLMGNCERWK